MNHQKRPERLSSEPLTPEQPTSGQLTLDGFQIDPPEPDESELEPPKPGEEAEAQEAEPKPIPPTTDQWAALFKVAKEIRQLEPWNELWSSDLIKIELPEHEEPFFCSTMGMNKECYGVVVYPGYQAFVSMQRLQDADSDIEELTMGCEQICLICNFGDREEVTPVDREAYNSLGLKFRGRNEWVYFRSMLPGRAPWYLDTVEADILIRVLKHYSRAFSFMIKNHLEVDFDNEEILTRFYSPNDKIWLNEVKAFPEGFAYRRLSISLTDELFVQSMLRKKKNNQYLEFDMGFLPVPFRDKRGERPYFSRVIALADRRTGLPIQAELVKDGEETINEILNIFANYIDQSGRPTRIYIRNDIAESYIGDLCRKLDIKLIEGEGVPVIDVFYEGLYDRYF